MDDLTELYEVAEWAVYHGYREISSKILAEIIAKGGTIGRHSLLEKRLSFDGYVYSVTTDSEGHKLFDSLKYLEELQQSFLSECRGDSTNEYHWLRIRQLTIMQLAIFKLKDQLQIGPTHSLPNRPSEIKIPKSFQIEEFEREVDELFAKYKKYTSSTVLGRIEDHAAEVFRENLMRPFCKDSNKVKFGIHHLLNMYPLKTFRFEATTFAKTVEREVLPPPGHFYLRSRDYQTKNPLPTPVFNMDQVWDEGTRESSGPYASNKAGPEDEADTDEQNITDEITNQKTKVKHPDNAALKNLQEQKSNFQAVNSKYDPLLEALGKSGQKSNCDPIPEAIGDLNERPVNSRAGARKTRSMTAQENQTPVKKSRLIDPRNTSTEVVWTESEEEDSVEGSKMSNLTIESVKKKNFDPQLSKSISSPSAQSLRDKSVRLAWTKDEEDALLAGVSIHGVGNWVAIINDPNLSYRFRGRTNVNLKDKYRNLTS